jgi:hypothetical protein
MKTIVHVLFLIVIALSSVSCSDNSIDPNFAKNLPGVYKYTQYNLSYRVEYTWVISRVSDKVVNLHSEMSYSAPPGHPITFRDTIENIVLAEPDHLKFTYANAGVDKYKLDAAGKLTGNILAVKLLTTWSVSPDENYNLKLEKQ